MDSTKGSCKVHAWRKEGRRKEEEEKDGPLIRRGPIRPALLIGIKWGCIGTIGTLYGLDQGFMQGSCVEEGGRKEEGRRKTGP